MRKAFSLLAFLFLVTLSTNAQTIAVKDTDGNYTQTQAKPTVETLTAGCEKSLAKFKDKDGKRYDVYLTKSGKLFTIRTSKKTGNPYRSYFTVAGN